MRPRSAADLRHDKEEGQMTELCRNGRKAGKRLLPYLWISIILLLSAVYLEDWEGQFLAIRIRQAVPWSMLLLGEYTLYLCGCLNYAAGGQTALQICMIGLLRGSVGTTSFWLFYLFMILLSSAAIGLIYTVLDVRLKIKPLCFTLAFQMIFGGLAAWLSGRIPYAGAYSPQWLTRSRWLALPLWVWFAIILLPVLGILLQNTRQGRKFQLLNCSEQLLRGGEQELWRIKAFGYLFGTILIGCAAFFFELRTNAAVLTNGNYFTTYLLIAVGIGGIYGLNGKNILFRAILGGFCLMSLDALFQKMHMTQNLGLCIGGVIFLLSFAMENGSTKILPPDPKITA